MALFTRRDRIAIVIIAALILAGWGIRLALHVRQEPDELRIIRNAVQLPESFTQRDNTFTGLININTAEETELETLPMIGPVKAAAITEHRRQHGLFFKPSDIMNVRGIGSVIYENIKEKITVTPPDSSNGH